MLTKMEKIHNRTAIKKQNKQTKSTWMILKRMSQMPKTLFKLPKTMSKVLKTC